MTSPRALTLCCTLKPSPAPSSSERLGREVLSALEGHGFDTDFVRVVDHSVKFGVEIDMGDGDEWPSIREKVLAADVLVIATPIWMGQPASICKMVMERLDAELSQTDDEGTYWVGEAMQPTDYLDKDPAPEKTAQTTRTMAANAAHLARLLRESNYPA